MALEPHAWSVPPVGAQSASEIRSGEGNDIFEGRASRAPAGSAQGCIEGREHAGFGVKEFAVVIPASIVHEKVCGAPKQAANLIVLTTALRVVATYCWWKARRQHTELGGGGSNCVWNNCWRRRSVS